MELTLFAIPYRKSKHAIEKRQSFVDTLLLNSRQYYLRVRMAAKFMAHGFKSRTQLGEVINFPVKNNHVPPALGVHGLVAVRRKIENRKPPVSEGNAGLRVSPHARIIGTAVDKLIGHPRDHNLHLEFVLRGGCQESSYSAHG